MSLALALSDRGAGHFWIRHLWERWSPALTIARVLSELYYCNSLSRCGFGRERERERERQMARTNGITTFSPDFSLSLALCVCGCL